jgi:mannitol-1-phosphate/altronate dehydrogenase
VADDRAGLLEVLAEAGEIATSLPAVGYYDVGPHSVAGLIAEGIKRNPAQSRIIYAAENNNQAAEILRDAVTQKLGIPLPDNVQFANTVIGKMSRVVTDADEIAQLGLKRITPQIDRAFLVEAFNRILIGRIRLADFKRGINVFIEKNDLLPFEEAKLYGHNAIHAMLAYLGAARGYTKMTELKDDPGVMKAARDAFLNESGAALIKKYAHLGDELFTPAGYRACADDLLERMTNPYLADTVTRAGRDVRRKLGRNDRIFGTMSLALSQGIEPKNMAIAAFAAIRFLLEHQDVPNIGGLRAHPTRFAELSDDDIREIIRWLWEEGAGEYDERIIACVLNAREQFAELL